MSTWLFAENEFNRNIDENNKYFYFYKDFFKRKIHELNIKKIYFFKHENISNKVLTNYFNSDCLSSNENEIFYIFNIKC